MVALMDRVRKTGVLFLLGIDPVVTCGWPVPTRAAP